MADIRALRLSRGLSLIDLAQLSEIPARRLAELEHGLQPLDRASRALLAHVFDVPPEQLHSVTRHKPASGYIGAWVRRGAFALIAAMIGLLLLIGVLPITQRAASAATLGEATPAPRAAAPTAAEQPRATTPARATARPVPTRTAPAPTTQPPTATPSFTLAADGPHGCPLVPAQGRVMITQGYGEGTHAPAGAWGAVDLGVDGDGDGYAEPGATQGAPAVATLGGVAHVYLDSWPGGNYVRIADATSGWSIAYAHLDSVAVSDGQTISAGALVGSTGSTGMASGPHLHYEVWHGEENVDPSGLIACR